MTKLTVLSPDDKLAEIRRLYFATTKQSIDADFARAVQLLKSMSSEDERERATVYMDGLAQMRSDWAREGGRSSNAGEAGAPGASRRAGKTARPVRTGKPDGAGGQGRRPEIAPEPRKSRKP